MTTLPHPSVDPFPNWTPAVDPRWYESIPTETIAKDLAAARARLQDAMRADTKNNRIKAYYARAAIKEFTGVLDYRGASSVGAIIDPVLVFDLDTMTTWLEASNG